MNWRRSLLIGLTTLAACGGAPRLAEAPKTPTVLTGEWLLDRSQSDDVRAKLRPIIGRKENELNRHIKQVGDIGEPEAAGPKSDAEGRNRGDEDASTFGWLRRQQRLEFEAVIAWLSPASQLQIDQQGRQFRFLSDKGEGTRRFVPGEESAVFNAFGGFNVSSGWDKSSFVVSSRGNGDNRFRILERYTLLGDGTELEQRVTARLPSLGKHEFRFVYRRRD